MPTGSDGLPEGHYFLGPAKPFRTPDTGKARDVELIHPPLRRQIVELRDGKAPWPLFLAGEAGCGKTCAALCMIDKFGGWWFTLGRFCRDLQAAMAGELQNNAGHKVTSVELWRDVQRAHVLAIDEIGRRSEPSEFHSDTLLELLQAREGRPLVVISNRDIADLGGIYDDPIVSRLDSGTTCWLEGDRRAAALRLAAEDGQPG